MDLHAGICVKGARAICEAVGENPKQIVRLVAELGLPAWRRGGSGSWRALPEDLKRWVHVQRNQHLPEALRAEGPEVRLGVRGQGGAHSPGSSPGASPS